MDARQWGALALAFGSSGTYFLGLAVFRRAAVDMTPLSGVHVVDAVRQLLTSWRWLGGAVVMGLGVLLQVLVLATLTVPDAEPAFVAGLLVLVMIGCGFFRERLSGAEWSCVLLLAVGSVVLARSLAGMRIADPVPAAGPTLYAISAISLVFPVSLFVLGDLRPSGIHARRLTGVAYGITSGMLIGTAEMSLAAIVRISPGDLMVTPYPYLFALAVCLGVGQLQIALQRCRMILVVSISAVLAKTQLTLCSALVLAVRPGFDHASRPLLVAGSALVGAALVLLPRHDGEAEVRNGFAASPR